MFTRHLKLGISLNELASEVAMESLEHIRQSSISTIEIPASFFYPDVETPIAILNNITSKGKLKVASIHASFGKQFDLSSSNSEIHKTAINEILHCMNNANKIGAKMVIAHSSIEPIADEERCERVQQTISSLNELKPIAMAKNVKIAVELLPRSCVGNTVSELLSIVNKVDSPFVGICLDVNHLMDKYETLPEVVRNLRDKLITLHLSDYDGIDEKHWFPGKGVID